VRQLALASRSTRPLPASPISRLRCFRTFWGRCSQIVLLAWIYEWLWVVGLSDGLHQNVAGQRWLLCDPRKTSMVIPHPNCAVRDPKMQMLELESPNWTPPILRSFGGDFPTKGSQNRLLQEQVNHKGEIRSSTAPF